PESKRGRIFEVSLDAATKHIERLIAAEGETPELFLLKSRILASRRADALLSEIVDKAEEKKEAEPKPEQPKAVPATPPVDECVELLKQIVARWPNFAPGQLALGRELVSILDDGALSPLSKDAEAGIAALQNYARLVPDDPRVWREMAQAYEQLEKDTEAEAAYRAAIQRDGAYPDHHAALVNFLLDREEMDKAKTAFTRMLKVSPDANEAFEYLDDGEGFDADSAKVRETLLLAFPKEVAASQSALRLLADLQEAQNKIAEAIKSTQRAIAIEATTEDYESLSRLYRQQRRFAEALAAANQALKLDDSATYIQFERACSLAQLGRKREAIAALKEAIESDGSPFFDLDEPDLQPLATMPEFKAMKEAMKEKLGGGK
ncbi:MAG: tetratricopeptide repeat protein, partial [Blastocatellia bacterium]